MAGYWKIHGEERNKFDNIFDSLGAVAGKLSGDKVKPILLNSKLPTEMLGQVWELSDIDKDGLLDREEFCLAMHLVYKALDHEPVPSFLPPDLVPPSKRKIFVGSSTTDAPCITSTASSALTTEPSFTLTHISANSHPGSGLSRDLIRDMEYDRFCSIFAQNVGTETHIAGPVARDILMKSGLPQSVLAHVWNICDQEQLGRLTQDQFVLAMHYINQKVKGIEVPTELPPDVLPIPVKTKDCFANSGDTSDSSGGVGDISAVTELDSLRREIEELCKEKETLTLEIRQKGQIAKYRSNEVQDLQSTLDRASTSLAQLESDKAECHTRLDELDQQQLKLDGMLADVRVKVQEETHTISTLQSKIKEQEMCISRQEEEFSRVKNKLEHLKKEEMQLQQTWEIGQRQLHSISKQATDTMDEIVEVKEQIKALAEKQKNVHSNIAQYDKAVMALKNEAEPSRLFIPDGTPSKKNDLFGASDSIKVNQNVGFIKDPFVNDSPFYGPTPESVAGSSLSDGSFTKDNQLGATSSYPNSNSGVLNDPFASAVKTAKDPFSDNCDPFNSANKEFSVAGFEGDPFGGSDPFSAAATGTPSKTTEKLVENACDMFRSSFFDQDNSESLFSDDHVSDLQKSEGSSDDPWGSISFDSRTVEGLKGIDTFGKDFEPAAEAPSFNSFQDQFSQIHRTKVTSNDTHEDAQLRWAAEQSELAKNEREKVEIQEQLDLAYAIKLSKEM